MKTPEQKERLREMLRAEAGEKNPAWKAFKTRLSNEFRAEKAPPLEIIAPAQRGAPGRRLAFGWLIPAFAVFLLGMSFFLWRQREQTRINPVIADAGQQTRPVVRALRRGDVYKSEKREIRFLGGQATLTEGDGKIRIAAKEFKADFRLRQKVDMQIDHPLVTVTITGTEFTLDTSAKRGSINLTEGRLHIALKSSPGAEPVLLVAPVRFEFSETSHQIKKAVPKKDKPLYRYELANGEVFFAHQVSRDAQVHKVEVLGGKAMQIAVEDIVRVAAVEAP